MIDITSEPMKSIEWIFNWIVDPLLNLIFPVNGPFDVALAILIIALLILQNVILWFFPD